MSRHVVNVYTAERPCEGCKHNVSRYRWDFLGLRTCSCCEDAGEARTLNGNRLRVLTAATDAVHVADRRRKRRTSEVLI